MTNINKSFKCISCSTDFPVSITTDLIITDLTIISKCPKCNNVMQIHFNIIEIQQSAPQQSQQQSLDESMNIFASSEIPGDEIKKLIEG